MRKDKFIHHELLKLEPKHAAQLKNVLRLSPKPLTNVLKLEKKAPTNVLKVLPLEKKAPKNLLTLAPKARVMPAHTLDLSRVKVTAVHDGAKSKLYVQPLQDEAQEKAQSPISSEKESAPDENILTNATRKEETFAPLGLTFKAAAILALLLTNWVGLSFVGATSSFFNDTEDSDGNLLTATLLDLLAESEADPRDIQCGGETTFFAMVQTNPESLAVKYGGLAEFVGGSHQFCDALSVVARKDGDVAYSGPLLNFLVPEMTGAAAWQFEVSLPQNATQFTHGTQCNVDLVFAGFESMQDSFDESGWTDLERVPIRLTKDITGCKDNGCTHEQGKINIEVENNNNATVVNTVDINVNTGNNSANGGSGGAGGNTGGGGGNGGAGGTIVTGGVSTNVVIDQQINTNETNINVSGCCTCQGGSSNCGSGQNKSTTPNSTNVSNTNNTSVNNSTNVSTNVNVQTNTSQGGSQNSGSQSQQPSSTSSGTSTSSLADEIKKKLEEQLANAGVNRRNR